METEQPSSLRATMEGGRIVVLVTLKGVEHKLFLSWISAWSFLNELQMAISLSDVIFRGIVAEMLRREEVRRLAREAKALAKAQK